MVQVSEGLCTNVMYGLWLAIVAIVVIAAIFNVFWWRRKLRGCTTNRASLGAVPTDADVASLYVIPKDTGKLLSELESVTNWCLLGIYLGVPPEDLNKIENDYRASIIYAVSTAN